jgi:ubiquinone/menaquinone biosynthesis C-methylase UbiE
MARTVANDFYERIENRIYARILAEVKGAQYILDVGCGSCDLPRFIARRTNARVIGIDISDEDFPTVGLKRRQRVAALVNCRKRNAENLRLFKPSSFDAAVSTYALHEFQRPLLVLKQIYRVLRSGARLVIVDFPRHSLAEQLWGERYFNTREVRALVRRAGFKNCEVNLIAKNQVLLAKARKILSYSSCSKIKRICIDMKHPRH